MRDIHTTIIELLTWLAENGPAHQHEMAKAGFTRVSSKVNYLREEDLIVGSASGVRGYVYALTGNGRRKVAISKQAGQIVPPRTIAFSGTYAGPQWADVRPGAMDALSLPSVGAGT